MTNLQSGDKLWLYEYEQMFVRFYILERFGGKNIRIFKMDLLFGIFCSEQSHILNLLPLRTPTKEGFTLSAAVVEQEESDGVPE